MKVDDYAFPGQSQELIDFKDQLMTLLNFGKYQAQVLNNPPTWKGAKGEFAFYQNGTAGALYFSTGDSLNPWVQVTAFTI